MSSETLQKFSQAEDLELIRLLGKDSHFLKWFKTHYDACMTIEEPPSVESKKTEGGYLVTATERFKIKITWLPLRERIKRKIKFWKK